MSIRCEVCGGVNIVKENGVFVCQDCGIGYSVDELKKLLSTEYNNSTDFITVPLADDVKKADEEDEMLSDDDVESVCADAISLISSGDNEEGISMLVQMAEDGYPEAQYKLAECFDSGFGTYKDEKEAAEWYRKAGEQGHAIAQYCLGYNYTYGIGVEQDYKKAAVWYKLSAENGNACGMVGLGKLYEDGLGIQQDFYCAHQWYEKAAELGDKDGMNNMV